MSMTIRTKASLVKKYVIRGTVTLQSPLLISMGAVPAEAPLDAYVMRMADGRPFIPGTSLAGVLRDAMAEHFGKPEDEEEPAAVRQVFGDIGEEDAQSSLSIADVVLTNCAAGEMKDGINTSPAMSKRDGVSIHPYTGAGIKSHKYDYEVLERNRPGETSGGQVEIIMTVREHMLPEDVHESACEKAAHWLTDTLASGIRLGAHTAKGFGQIVCKDAVCVEYDFHKPAAIQAWLDYAGYSVSENGIGYWLQTAKQYGCKTYRGKEAENRAEDTLDIRVRCRLRSSLIVRRSSVEVSEKDSSRQVTKQLMSYEDYVIPGMSVKGVLRHHAGYILQTVGITDDSFLQALMGGSGEEGSVKQKSRFFVDEIYIAPESVLKAEQARNRINRFTGGTIKTALFATEPIWQKDEETVPVTLHFAIHHCQAWEAGLAMFLLRDIWQGDVAFGGEKAIGRGTLAGCSATIAYGQDTYLLGADGAADEKARTALAGFAAKFMEKIQQAGGNA